MDTPNNTQSPKNIQLPTPAKVAPKRTAPARKVQPPKVEQGSALQASFNDDAKLVKAAPKRELQGPVVAAQYNDVNRTPNHDESMVSFSNIETPGSPLEFFYRDGKDGRTVRSYSFKHGQTYIIPNDVIDHINNTTARPIYDDREATNTSLNLKKRAGEPRYAFNLVR